MLSTKYLQILYLIYMYKHDLELTYKGWYAIKPKQLFQFIVANFFYNFSTRLY